MKFSRLIEQYEQLPEILFHGTTAENVGTMVRNGNILAPSFWTPDENMAWYFAEMAVEMGKGDGVSRIVGMHISSFDFSSFVVDNAMWHEPVEPVIEYHGLDELPSDDWDNAIYEKWINTKQTWIDSLLVLRSVIYTVQLNAKELIL